jgi:hypothetical protein
MPWHKQSRHTVCSQTLLVLRSVIQPGQVFKRWHSY